MHTGERLTQTEFDAMVDTLVANVEALEKSTARTLRITKVFIVVLTIELLVIATILAVRY